MSGTKSSERVAKYADMFSAMGTEPRLRIMQLAADGASRGAVVGDIQAELDIPGSTLSHHLDKLKIEGLVEIQRQGTFLRYTANTEALQELLQFLYAECCTRNKAVRPEQIVRICKWERNHEHYQCRNHFRRDIKEVVKEKYGEAALRVKSGGSSCCGATAKHRLLRSHHRQSLRRRAGRANSRGSAAGFAGLRQSDGTGSVESWRDCARSRLRRRHRRAAFGAARRPHGQSLRPRYDRRNASAGQ